MRMNHPIDSSSKSSLKAWLCQNHAFKREQFRVEEMHANKFIRLPWDKHYKRNTCLLPCTSQIMHLPVGNLEPWVSWIFFTFTYLLGGGTTQHIEVRRQLMGVSSSTILILEVKLRSPGLANVPLYLLSHRTSSLLKEFFVLFCFLGGYILFTYFYVYG